MVTRLQGYQQQPNCCPDLRETLWSLPYKVISIPSFQQVRQISFMKMHSLFIQGKPWGSTKDVS